MIYKKKDYKLAQEQRGPFNVTMALYLTSGKCFLIDQNYTRVTRVSNRVRKFSFAFSKSITYNT